MRVSWWWERGIDTAYLSHGPRISIWRTNGEVHLRWATRENEDRGVRVFVAPNGDFTMNIRDFHSAAVGFCHEVLSATRRRVEGIQNDGWGRKDCTVDLTRLVAEQIHREGLFAGVQRQVLETNWRDVRIQLSALKARIGWD